MDEYPVATIIQYIRILGGDVLYQNQFKKSYQRILEVKDSKAREIVKRIKVDADKMAESLKQREAHAPFVNDGMNDCWYYVENENQFLALKLSLYDIESSAFLIEISRFPQWILTISDGNGMGTIVPEEKMKTNISEYLVQTEEILGTKF